MREAASYDKIDDAAVKDRRELCAIHAPGFSLRDFYFGRSLEVAVRNWRASALT